MITNNFKMLYDMATYNNQIDQIVIVHCVNSIFVNVKGNKNVSGFCLPLIIDKVTQASKSRSQCMFV